MTTRTMALVTLLALCAAAPPLVAQNKKVYRCENAAGRVTYADEACKGGTELKNDDARNDEQRKAAADVAKREERLADKLARERRAENKATPVSTAALIPHTAAQDAAKPVAKTKAKTAKTAEKNRSQAQKKKNPRAGDAPPT